MFSTIGECFLSCQHFLCINYFRPSTKAATSGDEHACWKGFEDYADACNAWYEWVHHGTLPESLRGRYHSVHHPPLHPPLNDDMAIAGRHRNVTTPGNDVSPAVTVHLQATTTVQAPITPVRSQARSQHQPAPSTPSRNYAAPGPSRLAADTLETLTVVDDDEQSVYWVIVAGKRPGVYDDQ